MPTNESHWPRSARPAGAATSSFYSRRATTATMPPAVNHRPGAHCGSTALRNLAEAIDLDVDEAESFGLGAGIGFGYVAAGPAARMIMGRSAHLEPAFFDHLGIPLSHESGQSREAAWAALADQVAGGPVLAFVDLGYLPYFDTDTHFGPHTVLVVEVADDRVTVSDSEFETVQTVGRGAFDRAWSSTEGFGPLDRRWLAVEDPSPTVATPAATRAAVSLAATTMLEGGEGWGCQGVAGIEAFAAALPDWNDLPDPRWTARFAYQNVERRGTGGGAFRRLYADFLASLGPAVGLDRGLAGRMRDVADDWSALGDTLRTASERDDDAARRDDFEDAAAQAEAIAATEASLFADLEEMV